jgi:hypothetical protein
MKNLKFAGLFLIATALLFLPPKTSEAQTRVVSGLSVTQGSTLLYGNLNGVPSDSLQVSDSIAYLVSVAHTNAVDPFLTWQWTKVGSGTATITLTFLQSNDNVNWFAVPKGAALSAYSKSYTLSASGWNLVSFAQDTARFEGKYLKVYYITSSTASVKGRVNGILKTIIK